ncbi:MAG TPA: phosphatase PAP2 family protein [Actinomycetota bacterium]|nr:phosphatase PAP2 family protein [Actinomycetota bacterium]
MAVENPRGQAASHLEPRALRRRPTGAPPPLPRQIGRTGRLLVTLVIVALFATLASVLFGASAAAVDRFDARFLSWLARYRTDWLTDAAQMIDGIDSRWPLRALRWATILTLVAFRRWRHLLVFLGVVIAVELVTFQMASFIGRPRPYGVEILTDWDGFSMPSRPVASLAVTLVGMAYALVPAGRQRFLAKVAAAVVVWLVVLARTYLGVDHVTDLFMGLLIGVATPIVAYRLLTPNDVFPVTYRRGKTAHLDVTGRRATAIREAVSEQLGLEVTDIVPIGLSGSGGSTPLRLTLATADGVKQYAFAKLYAKNHVRADRWYKLGRQILYGALEDETPFGTVRRFVEYEDYTLRLMQDHGLPTPQPLGVVEITPEAEYMIVMEFFHGAVELSDADVDESVIRQGLELVRRLWEAGLAHRDIKPANLMVQDGRLRLIDVFFVQVRPSPWRQAVDLANMMLVLALRSDAETVYRIALEFFTPEEIAEAFAATRGVASPTQVRSMMKVDGRDLLAEFRRLAPPRDPIPIQRWSVKRVGMTVWVVFVAFFALSLVLQNWAVFT